MSGSPIQPNQSIFAQQRAPKEIHEKMAEESRIALDKLIAETAFPAIMTGHRYHLKASGRIVTITKLYDAGMVIDVQFDNGETVQVEVREFLKDADPA